MKVSFETSAECGGVRIKGAGTRLVTKAGKSTKALARKKFLRSVRPQTISEAVIHRGHDPTLRDQSVLLVSRSSTAGSKPLRNHRPKAS